MRKTNLILLAAMTLLVMSAADGEDNLLYDDFSKEVPGRWETVKGRGWWLEDGKFMTTPKTGDYAKSYSAVNFPIINGEIETVLHSTIKRSGSFGIMGKYIASDNYWRIRFAYWQVQLEVYTPDGKGDKHYDLFPYSMRDKNAGENPVRIRVEIVDSKVAFYVDDTLMCIFKDPLAGKAGKPGLTSESTSYSQSFKVRRTK